MQQWPHAVHAPLPPACSSMARELPRPDRRAEYPRVGRSTAPGKAPAGKQYLRPAAPPRAHAAPHPRSWPRGPGPCASAPAPPCICARSESSLRQPFLYISPPHAARPTPPIGIGLKGPLHATMRCIHRTHAKSAACNANAYSSRIRTAAAIVVVQRPFLSPTADCVMLLVRTILLEMR